MFLNYNMDFQEKYISFCKKNDEYIYKVKDNIDRKETVIKYSNTLVYSNILELLTQIKEEKKIGMLLLQNEDKLMESRKKINILTRKFRKSVSELYINILYIS